MVILLLYGFACMGTYKYPEKKVNVTDSITMYYPTSSAYTVNGDTVEFRNVMYDFYNMDVTKLNSSSQKVTNLLNHYANFGQGSIDYMNESCYLITIEFDDGSGFNYHSLIIPVDSFDKDSLTFKDNSTVYVFESSLVWSNNELNIKVDDYFHPHFFSFFFEMICPSICCL